MRLTLVLACSLLLYSPLGIEAGDIHRWQDENGRTHYGNVDVPKHAKRVDITHNVIETDDVERETWDKWMDGHVEPGGDPQVQIHIGDVHNNAADDEPNAGPPPKPAHHK